MKRGMVIQIISSTMMYFILGFFVLLVLIIFFAFIFGLRLFFVNSPSMHPQIPQGSAIIVSNRNIEEVSVGDIITFRLDTGMHLTHRVIYANLDSDTIITRGDTNNIPDGSIVYSAVVGRVVFHSMTLSAAFRFAVSPVGIILLIALPIGVVFANGAIQRRYSPKACSENMQM